MRHINFIAIFVLEPAVLGTVAATSAFGAGLRDLNKAKNGREFLTKAQEEQYRKSQQAQTWQKVQNPVRRLPARLLRQVLLAGPVILLSEVDSRRSQECRHRCPPLA